MPSAPMNLLPMTPSDAPNLQRTEREFRAERLGYALRSLAADLVDERTRSGVAKRSRGRRGPGAAVQ